MGAVGMPVTRHPPHRSQRALLTHWAPPSGTNVRAELLHKIRTHQARRVHILLSRSAYNDQVDRRSYPALCPDRGFLIAVPLRQRPSLHYLRRGQNPLCSVASSVLLRCPTSHPRACSSFGLYLHEPARACPGVNEISQVPVKGRLHVHGVYDGARSIPHLPLTYEMMLPSLQQNEIGTSKFGHFRRSIPSPWSPL